MMSVSLPGMSSHMLDNGFKHFPIRDRLTHRLHVLRHAVNDSWPLIRRMLLGVGQGMTLLTHVFEGLAGGGIQIRVLRFVYGFLGMPLQIGHKSPEFVVGWRLDVVHHAAHHPQAPDHAINHGWAPVRHMHAGVGQFMALCAILHKQLRTS